VQGERADRQAGKEDDPEPSFEWRQISQWLDRRRHHREKQEESDNPLLDQDLQEGLVGGPLPGELRRDRRPERSRAHAD